MMYHAVARQQTMEEDVVIRQAVEAVMTMMNRLTTTEREVEDVMTRMKNSETTATRSDDRSDCRALHALLLAVGVERNVDARLHADVEEMTACLENDTLLIANIDSELKLTSMMGRHALKYSNACSKTSPITTIGTK